MSGGRACKCSERHEPISPPDGSDRPGRLWRVTSYRCNHSHFHGGYQSSVYSGIQCLRCGSVWRTKAPYADAIGEATEDERFIASGFPDHAAHMALRGREPYR